MEKELLKFTYNELSNEINKIDKIKEELDDVKTSLIATKATINRFSDLDFSKESKTNEVDNIEDLLKILFNGANVTIKRVDIDE